MKDESLTVRVVSPVALEVTADGNLELAHRTTVEVDSEEDRLRVQSDGTLFVRNGDGEVWCGTLAELVAALERVEVYDRAVKAASRVRHGA